MRARRSVGIASAILLVLLAFPAVTAGAVGRTPAANESFFSVPTPASRPYQIVSGPDGNLWFTESDAGKIGRITTSGSITEFKVHAGSGPYGITVGPDGNIWFTERFNNAIAK